MKTLKIFLFVLNVGAVTAQNIGQWKIYSDMKDVRSSVLLSNEVWSATSGGAFKFTVGDTNYQIFTKADGLNSQALSAIGKDNKNRIWAGSEEGFINIIDPKSGAIEKIVDIVNSGKNKKQINNFFVKGDTVFVSVDFGLSIISASKLTILDSFLKFGSFTAETKVFNTLKTSLLYVCTENGVAVQKAGAQNLSAPESWENYQLRSHIPANAISKIVEYKGDILLGTSNGVFQLVNKSWQPFTLQGSNIIDLSVADNILFILTERQLFQYINNQSVKLYENQSAAFSQLNAVNSQTVYISSKNGLIEFKNSRAKFFFPDGPASNSFVNISVDPKGKLWVATGKDLRGKGFFEFDGTRWKVYDFKTYPLILSNDYINVHAAPDTTVYFANWGRGVTSFKNGKLTVYTTANSGMTGIPIDTTFVAISDVKTDSKGNAWIANHQSAARKPLSVLTKDNKWYHYSFTNPSLSEFDLIDKLAVDKYDTKWFIVMQGNRGIYYFNENKTLTDTRDDLQGIITKTDGLLSDIITSLAVDRKGYLWIGTSVGINVIIDTQKPKVTSTIALGLRNQTITCIAVDPLDQKWIGTKQGVFVLSPDGFGNPILYNTKNSPLPSDDIKSIAFDPKSGKVYIGTDYGLAVLTTASIQPKESFSQLFVYPNPVILSGDETIVTIDGLIRNSSIKVFDISSNLVSEFKSPGGKIAFWNGRDLKGNLVPSGIYVIVAYDDDADNVATAKVAVIRK